jgi:hypothetical protein
MNMIEIPCMHVKFAWLSRVVIGLLLFSGINEKSYSQESPRENGFRSKDSLYNANIQKSKLYGVYIPRDISDAMNRLDELTDLPAREKLKKIDEKTMARKLFFGLGRWIEYNWNFQEGSRMSHLLRKKGLTHTEDMTYTLLVLYHRHICAKPLESDVLIKQVAEERKAKIALEKANATVVDSFRIQVPRNE